MQDNLHIIDASARCRHLQSKGMYINYNLPPGEEIVGDGHFWCGMTQSSFGPDNELCNPEECAKSGRSCHVPK
jgi:hypothetical protein